MRAVVLLLLLFAAKEAKAHDTWADGSAVPPWVKASCCGPEDVHHLTAAQVHYLPNGIRVDGYPDLLSYDQELPSQDGDYWIFYKEIAPGQFTRVYCFFAPEKGF